MRNITSFITGILNKGNREMDINLHPLLVRAKKQEANFISHEVRVKQTVLFLELTADLNNGTALFTAPFSVPTMAKRSKHNIRIYRHVSSSCSFVWVYYDNTNYTYVIVLYNIDRN